MITAAIFLVFLLQSHNFEPFEARVRRQTEIVAQPWVNEWGDRAAGGMLERKTLGVIPQFATVTVLGPGSSLYAKVRFGSQEGYVSILALDRTDPNTKARVNRLMEIGRALNHQVELEKIHLAYTQGKVENPRLDALIERYGEEEGTMIFNGTLKIGMSEEAARAIQGPPDEINRTTTEAGTREQWVYRGEKTIYLYIVGGQLAAIQN